MAAAAPLAGQVGAEPKALPTGISLKVEFEPEGGERGRYEWAVIKHDSVRAIVTFWLASDVSL